MWGSTGLIKGDKGLYRGLCRGVLYGLLRGIRGYIEDCRGEYFWLIKRDMRSLDDRSWELLSTLGF